jgi:SAM-dependent methyltransferase
MESNAGYAQEAPDLLRRYESIATADALRAVIHLIPSHPCDLLDIGAGTGRDAAAFAALGHRVVAVEPTDEMRLGAQRLHPSPRIEWIADGLPELAAVRGRRFDVVTLTAVWMHLDEEQRGRAMAVVCALLRPGGAMTLSQRHGPIPQGRRMFDVSAEETIGLAAKEGLACVHCSLEKSRRQAGVTWTWLGFRKPDPAG